MHLQKAGQWIFESKFDGYRLLARIEDGAVRLFTRNGKDWTTKMPALARAFAALPLQSGWVDGEVLMLDSDSRPDFQSLQNAFDGERTDHLVFFAFDLLWQDGQDLRPQPVEQRRQQLQALLHKAPSTAFASARPLTPRPPTWWPLPASWAWRA